MRFVITVLGIVSLSFLSAQIVIGPNDMPSAGDTLRFSTAADTEVDFTGTGADHVWDHTQLIAATDDQDIAVPVASTPILYQLYFGNPLLPDHLASFAMEGMDLSFQNFSIEEVYDYFKKDPFGYWNVGFGAMVNGLPRSIRRLPTDRIYQFPLTFGAQDSSFSTWSTDIPGLFYIEQEQWRVNEVDGWGTLYLPTDTFEVLRVRSVLNRHDSIYVEQFGTGFGLDEPEMVEYKWLAQGMGRPVLTIVTVGGVASQIEFYNDQAIGTGMSQTDAQPEIKLYPNPVKELLELKIRDNAGGILQIRDLQGRVVLVIGEIGMAEILNVPVHMLPNGTYSVELIGKERNWIRQFVVAR